MIIQMLLADVSSEKWNKCMQECQGNYELCTQIAESMADMYNCSFSLRQCRKHCPQPHAVTSQDAAFSMVSDYSDVADRKRLQQKKVFQKMYKKVYEKIYEKMQRKGIL